MIGLSHGDMFAVKVASARGEVAQAILLAEIKMLGQFCCTYIVQYMGYSIHNNALMLLTALHPAGNLYDSLLASDRYQFWNE